MIRSTTPRPGARYGQWTVVGRVRTAGDVMQRRPYVPCRCVCGLRQLITVHNLRTGKTSMCVRCRNMPKLSRILTRTDLGPRISDLAWLPEPNAQPINPMARW